MPADLSELVRRAFEAFEPPDVDALLELLHPDVEVKSLMTEAERTNYEGEAGVREWFAAVLGVFPDWRPRLEWVREVAAGQALARFQVTATGAASGVEIDQRYWLAALARDGLIGWYGFYRTESEARAALAEV